MRTVKYVLALCTVALLVGCGVSPSAPQLNEGQGRLVARNDVIPAKSQLVFGRDHQFANGVTISVSTPRSFRPSETAYPRSPRAVAFEIAIKNDGPQPYRLSGLSVVATVGGTTVKQVVDSVQGFAGVVGADRDISASRNVRLTLAFAVPAETIEMQLALRPNPANSDIALYCGSA